MGQTFEPKQRYAVAFGGNVKISQKNASIVCLAIKNKPLNRARRLLEDLNTGRRSLEGKYYSNAVGAILNLLNSCEKNAEFKGLDMDRLFVHASAHKGTNLRRRRRKGAFGSTMKATNMEVMLIERGKTPTKKVSKKKIREQLEGKRPVEDKTIKEEIHKLKEQQSELKDHVEHAKQHKEEKKGE